MASPRRPLLTLLALAVLTLKPFPVYAELAAEQSRIETQANDTIPPALLHVAAGISSALTAGALAALHSEPWHNRRARRSVAAIAFSASLAAGGAKEIMDLAGFGNPSMTDIIVTAVGGIAGSAAITALTAQAEGRENGRTMAAGAISVGIFFTIPVWNALFERL